MLRAGAYRCHIENHILAGNTALPWLAAWPTANQQQPAVPDQWLAFPGVPGTTTPRGGFEVRLGNGSRPVGGHRRGVRSRVGDAVDIGPADATAWLSQHGAEYGLCQIYRNEPWYYELRPEAIEHGCPPMYADPTHDPRMRQ
jgi:hypothetical protein